MNEPTTWITAIAVLALLLCLRRRRTGDSEPLADRKTEKLIEDWRDGK